MAGQAVPLVPLLDTPRVVPPPPATPALSGGHTAGSSSLEQQGFLLA